MDPKIEERVRNICSIAEEVIGEDRLPLLLKNKPKIIAYDGFEPSGKLSLPQGLMRADSVNMLTSNGVKFKFWVADWFAQLNHKMDGDLKKIQKAGRLMIETWKACGMDMDNVEFIWASEEINKHPDQYWTLVMDIASKLTLQRVMRCTPIMGRSEADELSASHVFYPVMQCADIFFLGADICSLGMDQRKVNAMAIDYCDKIKRKHKPVILSHHMLMGLDGSTKMSKSNPDNTIFMDDEAHDVKKKIKKAFCEPGNIVQNPILEYVKYLILPVIRPFVIDRKEEHGGPLTYMNFDQLEADFGSEVLHPDDLKNATIKYINQRLEPVRKHFAENKEAMDLLKEVRKLRK